ncbi:MAG TPA: vWA domain-containing protein [Verrucomicrobiae bacterium]|nr:vWA domain-containing protein [Verrucomicrobiae bacterium]
MKTFSRTLVTGLAVLAMICPAFAKDKTMAESAEPAKKPLVQLAVLLDTSGSMDGLIDQAKSQLWKIVNEFLKARQDGQTPEVQVALYEYGKSSLSPQSGWIRRIQPLTTDLDKLSEDLFALKTNGGDEYCGWVIKDAVNELAWSDDPKVYRAILIAGNEPFTQGPVNYADACKAAIAKGIIVNTIHCGSEAEGINGKWQDGALLADGKYLVIDQNRAVVHIEAPQDQELARLSADLNKTYLAYGDAGRAAAQRQAAQDANAATLAPSSGAVVQRALTKASVNYFNGNWDLVDATKDSNFKLEAVKTADLPAEMQQLSPAERQEYVQKKAGERSGLQAKIQTLNAEREKYLAAQMKQQAATNTLDAVVIAAVREQAAKRDFRFE